MNREPEHDEAVDRSLDSGSSETADAVVAPAVVAPAPAPLAHDLADGVARHVDPRQVRVQRLSGWISTGLIGLPLLAGASVLAALPAVPLWLRALAPAAAVIVVGALAWFAQVWPPVEHRHTTYRLDGRGLEINRGVLWRDSVLVPRSRIQHTDVAQGPIQRRFGLATLLVHTAGTEYARVGLPGLAHALAMRIRDHLAAGGLDDGV